MASFEERIRLRPKAELHVHLVGAAPRDFLAEQMARRSPREALASAERRHVELFRRHRHLAPFLEEGARPPRPEDLYAFTSFEGFLASYLMSVFFLRSARDIAGLVQRFREELASQNIVYAEATISPAEHLLVPGIRLEELCDLLDETAAGPGAELVWIVDLVRNLGPERTGDLLERILARRPKTLVGLTLGGAEHLFPPAQFEQVFGRARDAGLKLSIHAGEALGPESVWDAVRVLRVDRIGHGVRAIEDPALVEFLAEREIPLEICPTSNLRTGLYASYQQHPVARLHRAGAPVTVNTDDPAFFGTDLTREYLHLREAGLEEEEIEVIARNGFRYAFSQVDDPAGGTRRPA